MSVNIKNFYFFWYIINSTSNRNKGNAILRTIWASRPITRVPLIMFSDRNIKKMMAPSDTLCSIPKIQKICDFIITPHLMVPKCHILSITEISGCETFVLFIRILYNDRSTIGQAPLYQGIVRARPIVVVFSMILPQNTAAGGLT